MHSDADQLGEMKGGKPVSSVDDRLMDTNQPAREGPGIFTRSKRVRDRVVRRRHFTCFWHQGDYPQRSYTRPNPEVLPPLQQRMVDFHERHLSTWGTPPAIA